MEGFIKLHRAWTNNGTIMKDSDHLAVWVILHMLATVKEQERYFGKEKILVKSGQMIVVHRSIYEELKIEPTKLRRILKSFKNDGLIDYQTNRHETLITLTLWGDYQGKNAEQNAEPMPNQCRTTAEAQKREKTKKRKEAKEKKKKREKYTRKREG